MCAKPNMEQKCFGQNYDLENVVTPVNVTEIVKLLTESKYLMDKTHFLIKGFKEGFDIGYQGPKIKSSTSQNLPIWGIRNETILWNKLIKEVNERRVAGLFNYVPFVNIVNNMQSPIGLVPKDNGRKTRLIFHLSYGFKDGLGSLNANTPKNLCSVKYHDLDEVVANCLDLVEEIKANYVKTGNFATKPLYLAKLTSKCF